MIWQKNEFILSLCVLTKNRDFVSMCRDFRDFCLMCIGVTITPIFSRSALTLSQTHHNWSAKTSKYSCSFISVGGNAKAKSQENSWWCDEIAVSIEIIQDQKLLEMMMLPFQMIADDQNLIDMSRPEHFLKKNSAFQNIEIF